MHHMLGYSGEATQRDDCDNDIDRSFEHERKDAREENHEQHRPDETDLANDGSQALPKTMHCTLQSVKPKVAEEKIWKKEGLRNGTYHDQASRAFAQ